MQSPSPAAGTITAGDPERAHPRSYAFYREALADVTFPCAFVDLDRIARNAQDIAERASGTQVRIASKSVRSRALLQHLLSLDETFDGIMCYSGEEAAFLAAAGFQELLVAYPIWQTAEIKAACRAQQEGATVVLMVDSVDHVKRLAEVGKRRGQTMQVCLDIDLSTSHLGIHFGVRRSGITAPGGALHVCEAIDATSHVSLAGVMGYEAQLAGIPDRSPANNRLVNAVLRTLKRRSRPTVRDRRPKIVEAIEEAGHELAFVNGGGTGCVEFTVDDPAVTEVTVGSGFYAPALFDYYDQFQHDPAAGFAIEVTRTPTDGIYTCRGGGYIASGPPQVDRQPKPWYPSEATFRDEEGAGEVQTPIRYDDDLDLGDPVFLRHAKAGELCEQFEELYLIADGSVVETVPTYRGEGRCFL